MRLVYTKSGAEVKVGDEIKLHDGSFVVVLSIELPHKPSSTGRVHVRGKRKDDFPRSFYPNVIDAEWVERGDE